jgi:O-antigen ligase
MVTQGERVLAGSITGLFLTLPLANTLTLDLGFPLTIAHVFAMVAAITMLWLDRSHPRPLTWLPASLFLAFCVAYTLSFATNLGSDVHQYPWATGRDAPDIRSATKVLWLLGNVAIAFVIANGVRRTKMERRAIQSLGLGAVLSAIYGLYQVIGETHGFYVPVLPGTEFIPGTASYWIVLRAKSTFLEPSFFGAYLAVVVPFVAVGWMHASTRGRHGLWTTLLMLSTVIAGIIVTFAIGGWLPAAISGIVITGLSKPIGVRATGLRLGSAALIAVAAVTFLLPGVPSAVSALAFKGALGSGVIADQPQPSTTPAEAPPPELAARSAAERAATASAALEMFVASPIVGVGPGNFGLRYPEFRPAGVAEPTQLLIANNIYAEVLAESGLLGFLTFFGGFLGLIFMAVGAYRREGGQRRLEVGAGLAALGAMAVTFLTSPTFTLLYQWAILGLVAAFVARSHSLKVWSADLLTPDPATVPAP